MEGIKCPSSCNHYKYSTSFETHLLTKHPHIAKPLIARQATESPENTDQGYEDLDESFLHNGDDEFNSLIIDYSTSHDSDLVFESEFTANVEQLSSTVTYESARISCADAPRIKEHEEHLHKDMWALFG